MVGPIDNNTKKSSPESSIIKKTETAEEKLARIRQGHFKILAAMARNQNPMAENSNNSSNIALINSSLIQAEQTIEATAVLERIEKALATNTIEKGLPYHGKIIRYDTSKKNFDGKTPVEFQYQLKYDDQTRPSSSHISNVITVVNERGTKVFETKGKTEKGTHSFKWDGKDSKGKSLPAGTYKIKMEAAFERSVDGQVLKTPIEAGAFVSGRVDSVDIQNGKVKLMVNGKAIDIEDIIKVEKETKEEKAPQISEYASYIGTTAEIDDNEISVKTGGYAHITYKCDLERPGKLSAHVIDESGKLLGVAIADGISKGTNSLKIKVSNALTEQGAQNYLNGDESFTPLPNGKYKYKLFIQDNLGEDPNKYNEIATTRLVTITGLDFGKEPYVMAGEEKFKVSAITKLTTPQQTENLFQDAAQYIDKIATVELSTLELKPGGVEEFIQIPPPPPSVEYRKAIMRIYDANGKQVAELSKNPNSFVMSDIPNIAYINKDSLFDFLTNESKNRICGDRAIARSNNIAEVQAAFVAAAAAGGRNDFKGFKTEVLNDVKKGELEIDYNKIYDGYNTLSTSNQNIIRNSIQIIFDYTDIVRDYAALPPSEQELIKKAVNTHKPLTGFKWDGKDSSGLPAPFGTYKYEFSLETVRLDPGRAAGVVQIKKLRNTARVNISGCKTEGGEIRFIGNRLDETGRIVAGSPIEFSLSEIVQLST